MMAVLKRALCVACLLAACAAHAGGAGPTKPDPMTVLMRAVDETDASLAAEIDAVRAADGAAAAPDPVLLFQSASASPGDLATGLELAAAADAWHERMMRHGAGRLVMVGGESPAARASARAVVALAAGATAVLDRAIEAADRASDEGRAVPDDDAVMRALHSRQVVLPLRAARAALVVAASMPAGEGRKRLAALSLESAVRVEAVSAWSEAERLVLSGWGLTLMDRGAEALVALEKARAAAMAKDAEGAVRDAALIDVTLGEGLAMLEARGPVSARELVQKRIGEPPFVDGERVDLPACLAALDVLIRIAPREAATFHDGSARNSALSWPWRSAEGLLSRLAFAERGAMYAHLGKRVAEAALFDGQPGSARVSFAWSALAATPPRNEEARRVIEPLADPGSPPRNAVERDAWRLYLRAASAAEDAEVLARVSRIGLAMAECCPQEPGIGEMVGAAAHGAERRIRLAKTAEESLRARDDLLAALRLLSSGSIEMEESARDPWRLALGRIMLELVRRGPLEESMRHAGEAMGTLRLITGDAAGLEGEALLARVWSALLRVAEDAADESAPIGRIAAQLLDLCDPKKVRAAGSASDRDDLRDVMAACRGQALVSMQRPADALAEIERLISAGAPENLAAQEVGIEALVTLEREAEARELVSRSKAAAATLGRLSRRAWSAIESATDGFIAGEPTMKPAPAVIVYRLAAEFAPDSDHAIMHRSRLAWALLLSGGAEEAANVFRAAQAADPASAGLRRGLGESLLAMGDEAGAFGAFSAIAQAFEARQDFSRDYWHAWTRLLEILARRPRSADEDARIRREIARLRSLDSALQQPDCMVRIKAVEERIAGNPGVPGDSGGAER